MNSYGCASLELVGEERFSDFMAFNSVRGFIAHWFPLENAVFMQKKKYIKRRDFNTTGTKLQCSSSRCTGALRGTTGSRLTTMATMRPDWHATQAAALWLFYLRWFDSLLTVVLSCASVLFPWMLADGALSAWSLCGHDDNGAYDSVQSLFGALLAIIKQLVADKFLILFVGKQDEECWRLVGKAVNPQHPLILTN